MIIDSHCHLDFDKIYSQLDDVVNRANKNNVKILLTICTTLESFDKIKFIINKYNNIYGTFGIHPHETNNYKEISSKIIINYKKRNKKIIGIGETGLDFYYENSKKKDQIDSFITHIEASITLNYPLIVHSRSAEEETFNILNRYKNSNIKILMHCFTGSKEFAKKLMNLNTYFSASGIITFKNSTDLQKTFKFIDKNRILIETDSPFLAPIPMRGKKNEPSYLKYTLEKLSQIKSININELEQITNNNFEKLFS